VREEARPSQSSLEPITIPSSNDADSEIIDILSSSSGEDSGVESDKNDIAHGQDDPDAEVGPSLAAMTLAGTQEEWDATSDFFDYNPEDKQMDKGKKLFGMNITLRPGQLHGTWHYLDAVYLKGFDGAINAYDTGIGKTAVGLGVLAVQRTAQIMGRLCEGDPDSCELAQFFGYSDCVCRKGSLMSAIHRGLAQGITVFFAPKTTVEGAYQAARGALMQSVQLPDGTDFDFVTVIPPGSVVDMQYKMFDLRGQPTDTDIKVERRTKPAASSSRFNPGRTGRSGSKGKDPFDALNRDVQPYKSGAGLQDTAVDYTAERKEALFERRHYLLILSSEGPSLAPTTTLVEAFCVRQQREVHGRKKTQVVKIAWALWCRMVIVDEFHRTKGEDTILYRTMELLRQRHPGPHASRLVTLFMSATPFTNDLKGSLHSPIKFIIPRSWDGKDREQHATRNREYFDNVVSSLCAARKRHDAMVANDPSSEALEELKSIMSQKLKLLKGFMAQIMTRRTAQSGFQGEKELKLPHHDIRLVDVISGGLGPAEQRQFATIVRDAQKRAAGGEYLLECSHSIPASHSLSIGSFADDDE
jgi:hypothetical protein